MIFRMLEYYQKVCFYNGLKCYKIQNITDIEKAYDNKIAYNLEGHSESYYFASIVKNLKRTGKLGEGSRERTMEIFELTERMNGKNNTKSCKCYEKVSQTNANRRSVLLRDLMSQMQ